MATCFSGTTEGAWSYKDVTMTLINASPTFTVTYADTNASTIAITSDNQQIIRNNSTLQINISNASAKKYATLSSLKAIINGVEYNGTISGTTGTINVGTLNLSSDTEAVVTLVDSRGLGSGEYVTIEILDWQLPTGIVSLQRQNNFYSQTDINVDANYSSLDSKNVLTLKVRSKKVDEGSYGAYTTLTDNVTTTLTLDNNFQWDVQVLVQDLIGSTTYNLTIDRGIPIIFFDRLKRSVGVNCFPNNNEALEVKGTNILTSINNNTTNISNITGTILWTNPDVSQDITTDTNITLDSDDYDVYEVIYAYNTSDIIEMSVKSTKGKGTLLLFTINNATTYRRIIEYVDDFTLTIRAQEQSQNSYAIPVYIIGYKTGLI